MKYIRPILIGLVPLIIGVFFGFLLETWQTERNNAIRYFAYNTFLRTEIIYRPFSSNDDLEIFYRGEQIDNLSQAIVFLYNPSDRDFTNIPIYIDLIPSSGKNIEIVGEDAYGVNQLRDTVTPIYNLKQSENPEVIRYGYKLSTANHLGIYDPIFTAEYVILGNETPDVVVNIDKAGVTLSNYEDVPIPEYWWENILDPYVLYWYLPLGALLLFAIVSLYDYFIADPKQLKEWARKRPALYKRALLESIHVLGKKPDTDELAHFISYVVEKHFWEQTSAFYRFVTQMNEPKYEKPQKAQ